MSSKTLNLGSHIHSCQGEPISRPCTWGHTSNLKGDPITQTLYLLSHVHSPQVESTPQNLHLKSKVHHLQDDKHPRH